MQSMVSYPNRGPWGDPRYPGNCSGRLIHDLIEHYGPKTVADPAEGGGTTRAVCRERRIKYFGTDLREGFDLERDSLVSACPFRPDLVFLHPPYYRIIRYSGSVWGKEPHPADLSHEQDWDIYLRRLSLMIWNCRKVLSPKGHLAVLIGDVRQDGRYFSAQAAIHRWHEPKDIDAVIVKIQHHVSSDQKSYSGRIIRIQHEYCLVLRALGVSNAP